MKKKLLLSCFAVIGISALSQAQSNESLDINQVKSMVNAGGDLFWNFAGPKFEVPQGSGKHTIFTDNLWIGGLDPGNTLHLAAQTYRQNGTDFFQGPVSNPSEYNTNYDNQWNKVWKLSKAMIDSFRLGLYGVNVPQVIQTWPGNGNPLIGQALQLAPYVDVNADGMYSYQIGDYPCIKGDQAVFFMFNDDRAAHTESGAAKMGIEIHGMLYAYDMPGTALDTTIFLNYKIFNRSANDYNSVYVGNWADFDLGYYGDDYVGCDVGRNLFYCYNGDADDGSSPTPGAGTYGANPPVQAIMMLNGPLADPGDNVDNDRDGTTDENGETCAMSRFVSYQNNALVTGNPTMTGHYYNYLLGKWKDNSPVTYGGNGYGGNMSAAFMYPGTSDPNGWGTSFVPQAAWDETIAGNIPSDRHGVGSYGPFILSAGEEICIDYAFVWGRGNSGPGGSITVMQNNADDVRAFYDSTASCSCSSWPLGIPQQENLTVSLYPNPVNDILTIDYKAAGKNTRYAIYNPAGQIVSAGDIHDNHITVNVSMLARSVYYIRIFDESSVAVGKFIRQ
ncbi:MAG: hypothetical protein FD123_1268 [Bacteroidetes bacterium]|nr:MAG: hypothetical protein FD123_1268 [Bacteroidota bacterium]